jgi:hypothetical protein
MVSLLTPVDAPARAGRHRGAPADRTRLDAYPLNPVSRWLMRLVLALPYAVVGVAALLARSAGDGSGTLPNDDLVRRVAAIDWSRADAAWVSDLYPPISTLVGVLTPGGSIGLSIVGALLAGYFLQKVHEALLQKGFRRSTAALLLVGLAANPLFAYTALENLQSFLALVLFSLGLLDAMRFMAWANTEAGFRAGILFLMAVLSAPEAFVFVVIASITAAILRVKRDQPGVRMSNLTILIFPTAAAVLTMAALELAFLGQPFRFIVHALAPGYGLEPLATMLLTTPQGWLILAPLAVGSMSALAARRPWGVALAVAMFTVFILGAAVGIVPASAAGNTFIMLVMLAFAGLPASRTRGQEAVNRIAAVLLTAIAWASLGVRPALQEWIEPLLRTVGVA